MDFVELATWSHDLLRRQLQYAQQQQQQQQQYVVSPVEDDDFAHLSASSRTSPASQYGYHDQPTSDSIIDHYNNAYVDEYSTTGTGIGSHPILSKSAEAELYLLATNFLLYVAMVIITIIVAKIYFPESLQRGRGGSDSRSSSENDLQRAASTGLRRSYSYHRKESAGDEDIVTGTTDSDNLNDDSFYYEDDILDSSENMDEEDSELQDLTGKGNNRRSSRSSMTFLEFDQERTSRRKVVQRLLFCSFMLNVTFVAWGVLQVSLIMRGCAAKTRAVVTKPLLRPFLVVFVISPSSDDCFK